MPGELIRLPFAMSWRGWTFSSAAFATTLQAVARTHSPWQPPLLWLALLAASATLSAALEGTLSSRTAERPPGGERSAA
jgi:tellurite resistance protein